MNRTDRLYALVEELRAVAPRPRSAREGVGRWGAAGPGNRGSRCAAGAGGAAAGGGARAGGRPAGPGRGGGGGGVPPVIQEAMTARHVLRLDYQDLHDVVTVREVEPVAFAGIRTQWYLMAWCRLRGSARAFRVDRVLAAADTGEAAPCRPYADLDLDIPGALVRRPDLAGRPGTPGPAPRRNGAGRGGPFPGAGDRAGGRGRARRHRPPPDPRRADARGPPPPA